MGSISKKTVKKACLVARGFEDNELKSQEKQSHISGADLGFSRGGGGGFSKNFRKL